MAKKFSTRKKEKVTPMPRVHRDLTGLEVSIDSFGEIKSSMNIEKINKFLNENVGDKKLSDRGDFDEKRRLKEKKKIKAKPKDK